VCLLERGQELTPGEYPNNLAKAAATTRVTMPDGSIYGKKDGFLDFTISPNVVIWKGHGLGGGSLVNSNVSIRPDNRVFDTWPEEIQEDMDLLDRCYQMASDVLCPNPYPFQEVSVPFSSFFFSLFSFFNLFFFFFYLFFFFFFSFIFFCFFFLFCYAFCPLFYLVLSLLSLSN